MRIRLKDLVIPAAVGIASFGAGLWAGYAFKTAKLKKEVITAEEAESKDVQLSFEFEERTRNFNHAMQEAAVIIKRLKELEAKRLNEEPELAESVENHPSNLIIVPSANIKEDEPLVINVFPEEDDNWDYDEEISRRGPELPYIIHRDEYFSNEEDYRQSSLTYYEGDSILCDENDVPVYNPERVVGTLIFGHGSRDISICYVRNPHLQAEYEVIVDHGYYQSEILGHQPEPDLRHSHSVRKFRME